MFYDFSHDGINADSTFPPNGFDVAAGISEYHTAVKGLRYFRVRYVNDSVAQTYIRLSTNYGNFRQGNLPLNAVIGADADAQVFRTIDARLDLALERVGGVTSNVKFGRNEDVDTGAPEDVHGAGGEYTGHPVDFTPETVTILSTSSDDSSAGTGAQSVEISGLKTMLSTEYETEVVQTSGVGGGVSVNTWWRVNRMRVISAGSGGANAGNLTAVATTTTSIQFVFVRAGDNRSSVAAFTVPYDNTMIQLSRNGAITRVGNGSGSAELSFRIRPLGGVFEADPVYDIQTGSPLNIVYQSGKSYSALSDMKFRVDLVSDNNTKAQAEFEFILVRN